MLTREVGMPYLADAMERVMKVQQVILRAMSGALTWPQAADILGRSARSIRRMRWRYEHEGYDGLFDRRRHTPSPKRAPVAEVQHMLRLYREQYGPRDGHRGFNVRHFHHLARRDHGVTLSYSFVKKALHEAGLVAKGRPRGRHRRRREPRPCFGELLHLDGSRHQWLALCPGQYFTLIAVVDDATKRLLYAELTAAGEGMVVVMRALWQVFATYGLPIALYTDRAGWAVHTPTSGSAPDRTRRTQLGRALDRLGIEHILGHSPQARGRSERANRTLQDRLVNELRRAGITTVEAANRYLHAQFLPAYNAEFGRAPADPTTAWIPLHGVNLDQILCHEDERVVGRDNTVRLDNVLLQLAKQPGRRSCEGLRVIVRRHLNGHHSVWHGPRCFGLYNEHGRRLPISAVTCPPGPEPLSLRARSRRRATTSSKSLRGFHR
jgi:transposase